MVWIMFSYPPTGKDQININHPSINPSTNHKIYITMVIFNIPAIFKPYNSFLKKLFELKNCAFLLRRCMFDTKRSVSVSGDQCIY